MNEELNEDSGEEEEDSEDEDYSEEINRRPYEFRGIYLDKNSEKNSKAFVIFDLVGKDVNIYRDGMQGGGGSATYGCRLKVIFYGFRSKKNLKVKVAKKTVCVDSDEPDEVIINYDFRNDRLKVDGYNSFIEDNFLWPWGFKGFF